MACRYRASKKGNGGKRVGPPEYIETIKAKREDLPHAIHRYVITAKVLE